MKPPSLAAFVPTSDTMLLIVGAASVIGGVSLYDRRVGLIVAGVLCFLALYLKRGRGRTSTP